MLTAVRMLIVALAYMSTGALTVLASGTSQIAIPVWLAAGIALAATIAWGRWMLISIFVAIGSVHVLQAHQLHTSLHGFGHVIGPIGIATGSTIATLIGAHFGSRTLQHDQSLGSWSSAMLFLIGVGPAFAAISSSSAALVLLTSGEIQRDQMLASLVVWWQGDALGGMLVCPLLLTFAVPVRHERTTRIRHVVIPLTIITLTIIMINTIALRSEGSREKFNFERDAQRISERIRADYEQAATFVRSTERFIAASKQSPSSRQLNDFVRPALHQIPGVQSVAYVPLVHDAQRHMFERNNRHFMPRGITEQSAQGNVVQAKRRAWYAPVTVLTPRGRSSLSQGLDLGSNSAKRATIVAALASRSVTVSDPVHFQLHDSARGAHAYAPIHSRNTINDRLGKRVPKSLIVAEINIHDLVRRASEIDTEKMSLVIRDLDAPLSNRLLDVISETRGMKPQDMAEDISAFELNPSRTFRVIRNVPIDGRTWQLEFVPTKQFSSGTLSTVDWVLLVTSIMVSLSTSSFVLFLAGHSVDTEKEILRRVADLEFTERRLERLIDTAGEAFISIDRHGIVQDWNPEATAMFGWSRQQAIGSELAGLIIPDEMRDAHRLRLKVFNGSAVSNIVGRRVEMNARRNDGSEIPVEMLITYLPDGGEYTFHAFLHDISERRKLEAEREHAAELKTHFVAMASHEMRTPLTSIIGYSQTLEDRWNVLSDEQKQQFIHIIVEQGSRFSQLIEDLLTISQIEDGRLRAEPQAADVRRIIEEAINDTEVPASIDCDHPIFAWIKPDHLRQIIINFLRNASKYGSDPIEIHVQQRDGSVVIEVADHGSGVPEEFVPHLFERFSQAHFRESGKAQGVGLGLSIVTALAETYRGNAWYRPNTPHGAVFGVTIPLPPQKASVKLPDSQHPIQPKV